MTDAGSRPAEPSQGRVPQRQLYGVEGSSAFLECVPRSLRARVSWTYQRGPDAPQREVRAAGRGGGSLPSPCPDRRPGRRCSRTSGWCGRSGGCSCAACSGTTPGSTCAGPRSRASRSPCCAWRWASSAPPPPPPGVALPGTGTSCSCSSGPRRPAGGCGPPLPPRPGPPRGGGAGRSRSAVRSRGPPDAAVPGAGREPSAGPAAPLPGEAPPGLRAADRERPPGSAEGAGRGGGVFIDGWERWGAAPHGVGVPGLGWGWVRAGEGRPPRAVLMELNKAEEAARGPAQRCVPSRERPPLSLSCRMPGASPRPSATLSFPAKPKPELSTSPARLSPGDDRSLR